MGIDWHVKDFPTAMFFGDLSWLQPKPAAYEVAGIALP